jgi:hypothetical protein
MSSPFIVSTVGRPYTGAVSSNELLEVTFEAHRCSLDGAGNNGPEPRFGWLERRASGGGRGSVASAQALFVYTGGVLTAFAEYGYL